MSTITLDVPDEVAARFVALTDEEQRVFTSRLNAFARAALTDESGPGFGEALSPDDLASIGRGFADADAGRVMSAEDFSARIDERDAEARRLPMVSSLS